MTSRKLKPFAASLRTATLGLAGVLALAAGLTAKAQSESAASDNGLEGVWRLQVTVRNCQTGDPLRTFPALFSFHRGGTLTVTTAGQSPGLFTPGLGVWHQTGANTYSAVSEAFVFSPGGTWIQTHRLTRSIEISNEADEFTDTVKLEIFGTGGDLIATGCATSVASRFE